MTRNRKTAAWCYALGALLAAGVPASLPKCAAQMVRRPVTSPFLGTGPTMNAAAPAAAVMQQNFYGLHILHLAYGTAWPSISFGTWRLWDSGVDWAQLEPAANTYDWQTLDTYVALAKQKHIDVILELGQTPRWASARPNDPNNGAVAEPSNDKYWTDYVTAVATRYKGKIAYYEVWNEASSLTYWDGTPAKLAQLTTEAAKAIHAADPSAKVISPSIPTVDSSRLAWLKSLFDAGGGSAVDVIGVHLYSTGGKPESLLTEVQQLQTLLTSEKLTGKPIICTEFGWGPPTTFSSEDEQSGWYVRSVMAAWTAGVSRLMWYAWDNSNWVTLTMTQPDFKTPTQVDSAVTTLQGWTENHEVSPCVNTNNTWSCDITDTAGDHSRIYWNTTGSATVTPSLTWKPSAKVDMYGHVTTYKSGSIALTDLPILIRE